MNYFKNIILVICTIVLAVITIAVLTWTSVQRVNGKNGFERTFLSYNITLLNRMKKEDDIVGISGVTYHHLYFQTTSPDKIYQTDTGLRNGSYVSLNVPSNDVIRSRFDCVVDSPVVYLFAGNWPGIFTTNITNGNITGYKFPSALYTRNTVVSPFSFVLRAFDTSVKTADQIFIKGNPASSSLLREKNISERRNDIGISTDGLLHYDTLNHVLVYIFFYRNSFISFDSNLNLLYTHQTIDTFQTIQTKAGAIKTNMGITYTTTAPSRFTNMESCVAEGLLFNYSLLKGDNETTGNFEENCAIDIYRLKDGAYVGSFYIPAYKKEKIERFYVVRNKFIVLYHTNICIYLFQLHNRSKGK